MWDPRLFCRSWTGLSTSLLRPSRMVQRICLHSVQLKRKSFRWSNSPVGQMGIQSARVNYFGARSVPSGTHLSRMCTFFRSQFVLGWWITHETAKQGTFSQFKNGVGANHFKLSLVGTRKAGHCPNLLLRALSLSRILSH